MEKKQQQQQNEKTLNPRIKTAKKTTCRRLVVDFLYY